MTSFFREFGNQKNHVMFSKAAAQQAIGP